MESFNRAGLHLTRSNRKTSGNVPSKKGKHVISETYSPATPKGESPIKRGTARETFFGRESGTTCENA